MPDEAVSTIFLHFLDFSTLLRDSLSLSEEITITASGDSDTDQVSAVAPLNVYNSTTDIPASRQIALVSSRQIPW